MQTLISPEAFAHVDISVPQFCASCASLASPSSSSLPQGSRRGTCVTIGNFDGVHIGHQSLLQRTLQKAREYNLLSAVVTFWPHPLQVLAGSRAPALLMSQESRLALFESQGMDIALEMPFTKHLASLSPRDFVRTVLVPLECRELVIGYDFSLGKARAGNFEVLQALGQEYGFCVEQLSPVIVQDAVVSSTRIRTHIRAGEVWEARALLGRGYDIEGTVVHGHGRGKGLGYPTANMESASALVPRYGVYATFVRVLESCGLESCGLESCVDGASESRTGAFFPAVTNIGCVPTFGNESMSIESFILEGSPSLYEKRIALTFIERLRDEQKFNDAQELRFRIGKDIELAQDILKSVNMYCA